MVYNQELTELSVNDFDKIIEHSEKCLVEAYSRMKMTTQPWTKHTGELYNCGYHNVYGYDLSSNLISIAKQNNSEIESHFFVADCRKMQKVPKADVVLCLYDVIGSFAEQKENEKIVKQIKRHCKKNGIVIASVEEIKEMFSPFKVLDYRYVQSGHWDTKLKNTDLKAKEILTVFKKQRG